MADIPEFLKPSEAATMQQPTAVQQPTAAPAGTVPLLQVETNQVIHVPIPDVDVAVRSGLYVPKKNATFNVLNDTGEPGEVAGEHLHTVLNSGYTIEPPEATRKRLVQQKYGDSALRAFGEGAASSATFGLSDVAARAAGVSAEDLAGREEANPVASTLGQVAGFIPGLFTGSSEAAAAGKAATVGATALKGAGAATRAVDTLGTKVAAGVMKQAEKAGLSKSVSEGIVGKMLNAGVKGAVEGAFLGTGQLIHESALGSADFNAESLMQSAGFGALYGGALGSVLTAGFEGIAKAGGAAAGLASKVGSEFTNAEKAAFEIVGASPSQIVKQERRFGEKTFKVVENGVEKEITSDTFGKKLVSFLKNDVKISVSDDVEAILNKVSAKVEETGAGLKQLYKKADELAVEKPAVTVGVREANKDIAARINDRLLSKEAISGIAKNEIAEAKKVYQSFLEVASDDTGKVLKPSEIWKLRQEADAASKIDKLANQRSVKQEAYKIARDYWDEQLNQRIAMADKTLADTRLALNQQYHVGKFALDKLENKYAKKATLDPILTATFGVASGAITSGDLSDSMLHGAMALAARKFMHHDIRRNLVVLGKIEKAQQIWDKASKAAIDGFFNPAKKTVEPVILKTLVDHELGKSANGKKPANMTEAYRNFKDRMDRYQQNPDAFMQRINATTAQMHGIAPNTAMAVDATAVRAMMFLNSKMPRKSMAPGVLNVLQKPTLPSNYDLAKFHRYLTAVDNPKTFLKDIQTGKVSHEAVEAMKIVYPALYGKVQGLVMDQIQLKGNQLSYNKRVMLGTMFGIPADASLLPQNVMQLQGNFSAQSPEGAGAVKPTQKGMQNLDFSGRMDLDNKEE